jgi:hypothetical protein
MAIETNFALGRQKTSLSTTSVQQLIVCNAYDRNEEMIRDTT